MTLPLSYDKTNAPAESSVIARPNGPEGLTPQSRCSRDSAPMRGAKAAAPRNDTKMEKRTEKSVRFYIMY